MLGWLSLSAIVGVVGAACRTPLFSLIGALTLIIVPSAVELSFHGPGGYSAGVMCFVVPLVSASYLVTRHLVRRQRYPDGCCTACGYDLRGAAADRCSECGTPIVRVADPIRPWELEDWLTEVGNAVVAKRHDRGPEMLSPSELLLLEFWEFDTQQRNGGVSQYFCNNPIDRWQRLCSLVKPRSPTFAEFTDLVDAVIEGADDTYEAVIESAVDLDERYLNGWVPIVREIQAACSER